MDEIITLKRQEVDLMKKGNLKRNHLLEENKHKSTKMLKILRFKFF